MASRLCLSKKTQHRDYGYHDAGKRSANGDNADGFSLEVVEAVTQSAELRLHAVVAVFAAHDYFEGREQLS